MSLFALGVGLLFTLAGCGPEVGPTQTIKVEEPLASAAVTDVRLVMGTGELSLKPGSTGLMSGTIRCNVADWEPQVDRGDTHVTLEQKSRDAVAGAASTVVNEWELLLGKSPMRLEIEAGAYEGDLDLSGLTLLDLTIEEGAAKTRVMFNSANPGQIERFRYETGSSTVTLMGLANANFKSMEFSGGAGAYSFDFAGRVRTEATVRIRAGVGTVRIQIPAATAAKVTVKGSTTNVVTEGDWITNGSTHSTAAVGAPDAGKMLTIVLEMGVGTATLVAK